MMKKAGCRPPHWKTIFNLPLCSNSNQMKAFVAQPSTMEMESFIQPCKVINPLYYDYNEVDGHEIV